MTDTRPHFLQKLHPRPGKPHEYEVRVHTLSNAEAKPYATAALREEVATLLATGEGERNHRLNVAAFNLGQLVAGGHLDREEAWTALHTAALHIGLTPTETGATLRSGFGAGEQKPRVVPDPEETPAPELTTVAPTPESEEEEEEDEAMDWSRRFPRLDWHTLWEEEDEDEWIVYPIIPARRLVALFSPPKLGKSLLLLELAVQVSRGHEVLGHHPEKPRRVLYVDFENDPRGDIRSRLKAMGMTPYQLEDLVYLSFPPLSGLDTTLGGLELVAVAKFYGCELVVIDTISRAVVGEENENDTWLAFYRYTGKLLKAEEIACVRLDHTGKDHTKGMRGGSAKYGDVDVVWAMSKLGESTFRLECTANRLPIPDKILVVEREFTPLRHALSSRRTGDVLLDEENVIAEALEDLGVPLGWGRDRCASALRNAGVSFTEPRLRAVLHRRKERDPEPVIPALSVVGEDDE